MKKTPIPMKGRKFHIRVATLIASIRILASRYYNGFCRQYLLVPFSTTLKDGFTSICRWFAPNHQFS